MNVTALQDWKASGPKPPLEPPREPPHNDDMEARVAVLEQIAKTTEASLRELKEDLRAQRKEMVDEFRAQRKEMVDEFRAARDRHDRDFRITWGGMIGGAITLVGLMAKGFHWF